MERQGMEEQMKKDKLAALMGVSDEKESEEEDNYPDLWDDSEEEAKDEKQQMIATSSKTDEQTSGKYARNIVTEISPAKTFWRAEEYHQQYIAKNRNRLGRLFG